MMNLGLRFQTNGVKSRYSLYNRKESLGKYFEHKKYLFVPCSGKKEDNREEGIIRCLKKS